MKQFLHLLLTPLIILLFLFVAAGFVVLSFQPPSTDKTSYPFIIAKGENAGSVAKDLQKQGFIRSEFVFRLYLSFLGKSKSIQAGDYRLSKNATLSQLVDELTRGPIGVWVTIPEGLRKEEVGLKIAKELKDNPTEQKAFMDQFLKLTPDKEGFLFPDTYLLLKNSSADSIVSKLTDNFNRKVPDQLVNQAKQHGLTQSQMLTLASLVERETKTDAERPIVAGILLKRLKAGWPLQVDATLQYMEGSSCTIPGTFEALNTCQWWREIAPVERNIVSPYNTYLNHGLPPTPIANPGLSSIEAAANPQDSPYWFYLHDPQGNIHYAKTAEEHAQNIQTYLK